MSPPKLLSTDQEPPSEKLWWTVSALSFLEYSQTFDSSVLSFLLKIPPLMSFPVWALPILLGQYLLLSQQLPTLSLSELTHSSSFNQRLCTDDPRRHVSREAHSVSSSLCIATWKWLYQGPSLASQSECDQMESSFPKPHREAESFSSSLLLSLQILLIIYPQYFSNIPTFLIPIASTLDQTTAYLTFLTQHLFLLLPTYSLSAHHSQQGGSLSQHLRYPHWHVPSWHVLEWSQEQGKESVPDLTLAPEGFAPEWLVSFLFTFHWLHWLTSIPNFTTERCIITPQIRWAHIRVHHISLLLSLSFLLHNINIISSYFTGLFK